MKKTLLLYFLLCSATSLFAKKIFGKYDQWIPSDTLKYNVVLLEDIHRLEIRNKENVLYLEKYKPSEKLKNNEYLIQAAMPPYYTKDIPIMAEEIWSKERAKEMRGKETIILRVYISDEGEIKEITFLLFETTTITPQEIFLFEQKLKEKKFQLRTDDLKGSNYILLPFYVNFTRLAENY
ncbi:MAG: hypothetical protein LUG18_09950 [Candidatus Azobacteroides sp.]|nr:hypothetical protein [Candidatus Azobacteroides sp.]